MLMNKKLTLKEIAAEAGISLTAASMYLNGKAKHYKLSDATCERIGEVMRKHNFTPNLHARAIASKKTFLAGVLISDNIANSFWLKILSALEDVLSERGYHLLLSVTKQDPERQKKALRFMENQGVDGIIAAPVGGTAEEIRKFARKHPLVTLNSKIEGVSCAWNDDYAGGRAAMEGVLKAGHTRIAYVGASGPGSLRSRAYDELTRENGRTPLYFQDAGSFLKKRKQFTVAICHTDYIALELYQRANALRCVIPGDLAVIGYDNMDFVNLLSPVPPTVNQYKEELGKAAAALLLELIEKGNSCVLESRFEPYLVHGKNLSPQHRSMSGS